MTCLCHPLRFLLLQFHCGWAPLFLLFATVHIFISLPIVCVQPGGFLRKQLQSLPRPVSNTRKGHRLCTSYLRRDRTSNSYIYHCATTRTRFPFSFHFSYDATPYHCKKNWRALRRKLSVNVCGVFFFFNEYATHTQMVKLSFYCAT